MFGSWFLWRTSGAKQSRFKGLCVFITWLQLPQALHSLVVNMDLIMARNVLGFLSVFLRQAEALRWITGNVRKCFHWRPRKPPDKSSGSFVIFSVHFASQKLLVWTFFSAGVERMFWWSPSFVLTFSGCEWKSDKNLGSLWGGNLMGVFPVVPLPLLFVERSHEEALSSER